MRFPAENTLTQLREAHVDLALGMLTEHDRSLHSIWLFDSSHTVVMRHDQALGRQDLKRRVAVTVNHFPAVPRLLRQSDMIATLPRIATNDTDFNEGMRSTEAPIAIDPLSLYLIWHTRHDRDPGVIWMRERVERIAKACWAECSG